MRRIMYIEQKSGLDGEGRIGWVELSRSGRTYIYGGLRLRRVGGGYKYNCVCEESGEAYWVSGPHRDGADRLYGGVVHVDEDARVAYWTQVRRAPAQAEATRYRAGASTRTAPSERRNERRARGGR